MTDHEAPTAAHLGCHILWLVAIEHDWVAFCLGTEVPRHSAGCVGTYVVRTYVRRFSQCARASAACSTLLIGCQTYYSLQVDLQK